MGFGVYGGVEGVSVSEEAFTEKARAPFCCPAEGAVKVDSGFSLLQGEGLTGVPHT